MGIDFIRRAAPSFHKSLDRNRIELCTPTLFTKRPAVVQRAYAANFGMGQKLRSGEEVGVRLEGKCVHAFRGMDLVATFTSPSAELLDALAASFGEGCGLVQEVHEMACTAEIIIC